MAQIGIKLKPHLNSEQLKERYRKCKNSKEARRWHALWLMSEGTSTTQAANIVGFQPSWVRRFANRYNEQGPETVIDLHQINPGGGVRRLTPKQEEQLRKAIEEREPPDGGLWNGPKVAKWIKEKTGEKAHPQIGWVYLKRLGFSPQTPRPRHSKAANEEQKKGFKKNSTEK